MSDHVNARYDPARDAVVLAYESGTELAVYDRDEALSLAAELTRAAAEQARGDTGAAYLVRYEIRAGADNSVLSRGHRVVLATDDDAATATGFDVAAEDPHDDPRVDPAINVCVERLNPVHGKCQRQGWHNDQATDWIGGEVTFDMTAQVVTMGRQASLEVTDCSAESDALWDHNQASTSTNHDGPYSVYVEDAITAFWDDVDDRLANYN